MIKFNIVLSLFSIISGIGNIIVGMGPASQIYTNVDLTLAIIQISLAFSVAFTGFVKLGFITKNNFLASSHKYITIAFYIYIAVLILILKNYR